MRVAVVGSGYVGLVSGACLAAKGHRVTCVDLNQSVVDKLNRGEPHIHEKGLAQLLVEVRGAGNFLATTSLEDAIDACDGVLIAVGTPSENGVIDLSFVREAAGAIGRYLGAKDRFLPVVVKSTVIPGTTDTVVREALASASGKGGEAFGLGMNPEFLREGEAVQDFMEPDRIVLGAEDGKTRRFLEELYAPWSCDKLRVNTRTAELIKYANNALLATQISAINEIANLAATLGGVDIIDVVRGVHLDKRWNPIREDGRRVNPQILTYLVPGCGFGGSCFPKDVQALRSQGEALGLPMDMLNAVLDVNDHQPGQVCRILRNEMEVKGKTCLLLGLAFKPETDDVRESASFKIVDDLLAAGCNVVAHDPVAMPNFRRALGEKERLVRFVEDWPAHVVKADAIIVATKWDDYRGLAARDLAGKIVFDARRMLDAAQLAGATYLSIGRRIA